MLFSAGEYKASVTTDASSIEERSSVISKDAFEAIRDVSHSDDKGIDAPAITLKFLARKHFFALKPTSMHQMLAVHILTR